MVDAENQVIESAIWALAERCGAIATAKGFNVSQHASQIGLIATEVGEALEHVSASGNPATDNYNEHIAQMSLTYERFRRETTGHRDVSVVINEGELYEELADIVIRVMSYAGGNGKADVLAEAIMAKVKKNMSRPERHGKGF